MSDNSNEIKFNNSASIPASEVVALLEALNMITSLADKTTFNTSKEIMDATNQAYRDCADIARSALNNFYGKDKNERSKRE